MKKHTLIIYTAVALMLIGANVSAQNAATSMVDTTKKETRISAPYFKDGFKINFKEDGSAWAKINFVSQLWLMDNQNNPGSTVGRIATNNSYQVGLRRTRLTISSQVTDKVFIFGQIGSDGISSLTGGRNVPLQFLDMTVEYKLLGKWLTMGGGLSGWDGLSRYSNPSVPSCLALDMPLYQQATVNITDNTVRMPGIYAKGKLGKLDYRVVVNIPYPATTSTVIVQTTLLATANANPQFNASTFAGNKIQPHVQGYFMYQFLDQESNVTAGTVGSYLGQKKVFNVGAGFRYQKNAMWHGDYTAGTNTVTNAPVLNIKDTARTDMLLWNIDLFYDAPINKEKGSAVTAYVAYTNYGFGKNYIRNNNPLNPTTTANANTTGNFTPGQASFNGAGNQYPMIGTGSVYYAEAGYLLPKLKNNTQFQPYGQFMYANYQALKDAVIVWNLGVNYLIKGHNSKFTLDYQSRPVFNVSSTDSRLHDIKSARRGMIVLQYQIAF